MMTSPQCPELAKSPHTCRHSLESKMRLGLTVSALVALAPLSMSGQQRTFQDSLLDRLIGRWALHGMIAGRDTTHDVVAEWVLGHQYVQLHEVSREKDAKGQPAYEAIVYIGWDQPSSQYACLWLDSTGGGGLAAQAIGYAKRTGKEMAFLFKSGEASIFHTTFAYNSDTDTWQWLMDDEEHGKLEPFARVRLERE
jgi:hypothetical protein